MTDIEFSSGQSKAEKARMRARYAALLQAIGNGQATSGKYQGGLIRGAIVHELLTPERRVTRRGFDWLTTYTGPIAPAAEIVITEKTKSGPKRPVVPKRSDKRFREFAAEFIFNTMGHAQSHVMLHKRLFALPPDGFYLFAWLIVNGAQHRTAAGVALALGWPVERMAAAMRDILDEGYPLPARIALPAELADAA
jgi:hypothetical protein